MTSNDQAFESSVNLIIDYMIGRVVLAIVKNFTLIQMCFDSIHASAIAHNGLLQVLVCARYTCTVYIIVPLLILFLKIIFAFDRNVGI